MGYLDECRTQTSFKTLKYSQSGDSLPSFVSEKNIGGNLGGGCVTTGTGSLWVYLDVTVDVIDNFDVWSTLWNAQNAGTLSYTDGTSVAISNPEDKLQMFRVEFLNTPETTATKLFINTDGGSQGHGDTLLLLPGESQILKVVGVGMTQLKVSTYQDEATIRITAHCERGNPVP